MKNVMVTHNGTPIPPADWVCISSKNAGGRVSEETYVSPNSFKSVNKLFEAVNEHPFGHINLPKVAKINLLGNKIEIISPDPKDIGVVVGKGGRWVRAMSSAIGQKVNVTHTLCSSHTGYYLTQCMTVKNKKFYRPDLMVVWAEDKKIVHCYVLTGEDTSERHHILYDESTLLGNHEKWEIELEKRLTIIRV